MTILKQLFHSCALDMRWWVASEVRSAELSIITSYLTNASGIIVLLITPTKYGEFFPIFEQTRTVNIYGEHGIMAHIVISRKVVGKSTRDNPKRYCGWFWVHSFSKKFQRMAREAMDVCLRVLKESNKSRFYSYSVEESALIISHITFRDCRVHSFSDNLSRNSCIPWWLSQSELKNCIIQWFSF